MSVCPVMVACWCWCLPSLLCQTVLSSGASPQESYCGVPSGGRECVCNGEDCRGRGVM